MEWKGVTRLSQCPLDHWKSKKLIHFQSLSQEKIDFFFVPNHIVIKTCLATQDDSILKGERIMLPGTSVAWIARIQMHVFTATFSLPMSSRHQKTLKLHSVIWLAVQKDWINSPTELAADELLQLEQLDPHCV